MQVLNHLMDAFVTECRISNLENGALYFNLYEG